MRYLLVLLLVGCSSEPTLPPLISSVEKECAQKATEFVLARYPGTVLDEAGVPKCETPGMASEECQRFMQWGVVADRCMKSRGVY